MSQSFIKISDGYKTGKLAQVLDDGAMGTEAGLAVRIVGTVPVSGITSTGSGTSSAYDSTFPGVGTAIGFTDGYRMRSSFVYDASGNGSREWVQGIQLRATGVSGSIEIGTATNPIRTDPTGITVQPINAISLPLPTGAATETTLSGVLKTTDFTTRINTQGQKNMAGSTPVVLASDQGVIPVSDNGGSFTVDGTVTANIGTTNGLALNSTLTNGSQRVQITDGVNNATIVATADGYSLSTHNIPSGTQTIAGTVTANIGTTNGLALDTTVSGLQVSQGSTTSGQKGSLFLGAVTTVAPSYATGQSSPLSLTATGLLRTDGSGAIQPVSGTIAATQSGTWTVQPGNTANTTPWLTTINQGGNSANVVSTIDGYSLSTHNIPSGTQTVSGTVTANISGSISNTSFIATQTTAANLNATVVGTVTSNIGTTNGLALDSTLTGGAAKARLTDGTNTAAIVSTPDGYALSTHSLIYGTTVGGNVEFPIGATNEGHLQVDVASPLSAFGEVAVSEPTPVCQVDFVYSINPNQFITTLVGSGTIATTNGLLVASTTAHTNSSSSATTRRYLKYNPGQGGIARFTAVYTTGASGSTQIAGLGDGYNGYFFGYNGTAFGILYRSSASGSTVDTWIPQASWNGDNMLGGGGISNASSIMLHPTFGNVYQVKVTYLGFGNISFYVMSNIDGRFNLVHQLQYPNTTAQQLVSNPSMPLLWQASNTTNNTNIVLKAASGGLFVAGPKVFIGNKYGTSNSKTTITTQTNILTLKNMLTFNGVVNKSQVHLRSISACSDGGGNVATMRIIRNTTLGGSPSFSNIDGYNSVVQIDTAGTTITGGTIEYEIIFNDNSNVTENVMDIDLFMLPGDTYTFAGTSGASTTFAIGCIWEEDL